MSLKPEQHLETKLIHAGEPRPRIGGAVSMPIFQSSTFEYEVGTAYHDLRYIRLNNTPNHAVLHEKLAALENGEAALVAGSGMAAISTAILTVLEPGGHLLAHDCLYGGTHDFLTGDVQGLGLSYSFINAHDPDSWKARLRPNTRAIYVETITNPLIEVGDLLAAVRFAKEHGLIAMIDNTFASPVNFRPLEHGFDLVLHSGTKYLNGHSDIVAGAVIGSAELVERIRHKLNHFGGTLDPHACFLLHRGLKTLAVRVRHQNESAMQIARFLEGHEAVSRVFYPGLESHPHHAFARELFDGFGGMLSFELNPSEPSRDRLPFTSRSEVKGKGAVRTKENGAGEAADRLLNRLRLPAIAPSLGGVETLITRPATTSHVGMSPDDRKRLGISDGLVRLSAGLESPADLIDDFSQALEA